MVGGIATGVSLMVAIAIINRSVLDDFRRTLELIAGPAQLEITLGAGEVGFPESVVDSARADAGVEAALGLVRGTLAVADDPSDTLELFGVDLTKENTLERYHIGLVDGGSDTLAWLADPRSIALTTAFAASHGLAVGDRLTLSTRQGTAAFTVRGLLEPQGIARAFGGALAVMDLPAAQLALGKDQSGRPDRPGAASRRRASGGAGAARVRAAADPERRAAAPARHPLRRHPRLLPGDDRRPQPALPRRRHLHRLQHDLDGSGTPRRRARLAPPERRGAGAAPAPADARGPAAGRRRHAPRPRPGHRPRPRAARHGVHVDGRDLPAALPGRPARRRGGDAPAARGHRDRRRALRLVLRRPAGDVARAARGPACRPAQPRATHARRAAGCAVARPCRGRRNGARARGAAQVQLLGQRRLHVVAGVGDRDRRAAGPCLGAPPRPRTRPPVRPRGARGRGEPGARADTDGRHRGGHRARARRRHHGRLAVPEPPHLGQGLLRERLPRERPVGERHRHRGRLAREPDPGDAGGRSSNASGRPRDRHAAHPSGHDVPGPAHRRRRAERRPAGAVALPEVVVPGWRPRSGRPRGARRRGRQRLGELRRPVRQAAGRPHRPRHTERACSRCRWSASCRTTSRTAVR